MRRASALACALLFAALAARAGAGAGEAPACFAPREGGDDWAVSTPRASGFATDALCAALARADHVDANLHGVVVARHRRLVAELYRRGPDRPIDVFYGLMNPFGGDVSFGPDVVHDTRSVSKSVVGVLYGIELARGRVVAPDASALAQLPELADLRTPDRDAIRIADLLGMTSGLDWDEGALPNDETRLYWTSDPARFLFDRRVVATPGSVFHYDSGGTAVLALLLARGSGKTLPELAREALFEPLGITHWTWADDLRGRPLAFTGLRLRPRDMAKLGQLVLQHGVWGDRPVVPSAWIADATRPRISTGIRLAPDAAEPLGYGWQWWTGEAQWRGRALAYCAAFGNGGQRIFVVPELDLVVVTTAGEYGEMAINSTVGEIFAAIVAAVDEP